MVSLRTDRANDNNVRHVVNSIREDIIRVDSDLRTVVVVRRIPIEGRS